MYIHTYNLLTYVYIYIYTYSDENLIHFPYRYTISMANHAPAIGRQVDPVANLVSKDVPMLGVKKAGLLAVSSTELVMFL